ncbi:hypothetical protein ABDF71_04925 [Ochrobactrum sp. WV_118_8]
MTEARPFTIEKREIWEAFQHVNANQGAAGVDGQTLESFGERLGPNCVATIKVRFSVNQDETRAGV